MYIFQENRENHLNQGRQKKGRDDKMILYKRRESKSHNKLFIINVLDIKRKRKILLNIRTKSL
jgi:hypothetical protein